MDLFEPNDQKKLDLLNRSSIHRQGVEDEVKQISERTQDILTKALIVGGAVAITYLIARKISKRNTKKKGRGKKIKNAPESILHEEEHHAEEGSESPGAFGKIGSALLTQATIFLLGLAKQKVSQYLHSPAEQKAENNNGHS
ncbi:MAG: hypothetical protein WKF87_01180 [Chryseolinea sp.]